MTTADQFSTPIGLDRDTFMRRLIASLGHLNEGILGSDVAGAYVMNVGLSMGVAIEAEYKKFWGIDRPFTLDEYAHVIVDLKQRINGNFSLVSKDATKVVVQTTSCPFDEFVRQSPSLCFMTSSVFGGIAARNFGYAKSVLHRRIALGDPGCYVTVHLQRTPEAEAAVGKEYFPEIEQASPDIAEQLRLMDSIRQLHRQLGEANWNELVSEAAEAIFVIGVAGVLIFANARWRELLGVEGNELVGGAIDKLVHPDDQQHVREMLASAFQGARVSGLFCRLRHRGGAWREALLSISPVRDEAGAITGALGICRDVTEEREARRLKDDFLSSASHELRTPITTIRGLTDLLLYTLGTRGTIEPEQLARRLQSIRREADRLALLSTDLLDVSRLQVGRLPLRTEPHDLNEIVAACVERQQDLLGDAPEHQVAFQRKATALPVNVERARIEQVVCNLLDNAVKYSPLGGPINVTTEPVGNWVHASIADQGIGIPAKDLPKLFTPFFRGSNASARSFMGLGVGLYLSRALVEAQGGKLLVQSVEGRGSTFTLVLPRHSGERE